MTHNTDTLCCKGFLNNSDKNKNGSSLSLVSFHGTQFQPRPHSRPERQAPQSQETPSRGPGVPKVRQQRVCGGARVLRCAWPQGLSTSLLHQNNCTLQPRGPRPGFLYLGNVWLLRGPSWAQIALRELGSGLQGACGLSRSQDWESLGAPVRYCPLIRPCSCHTGTKTPLQQPPL